MRVLRLRSARGYALVALVILIAISSILMAKAVESWQAVVKRDREEELIFRGEAYADAIKRFQKKRGALPTSLEDLHKKPETFIRQLYKDPMTKNEDGDWGGEFAVIFSSPTGQPILPGQAPGGGGTLPGPEDEKGSQKPSQGAFGAPAGGGPIIGVYSKSDEDSIKVYDGKTKYSEWFFVMKPDQPAQPGGKGGPPGGPPPGGGGPPGGGPPPGGGQSGG